MKKTSLLLLLATAASATLAADVTTITPVVSVTNQQINKFKQLYLTDVMLQE